MSWRTQSTGEEIANSITHGIGAAFALFGTYRLAAWALANGDGWRIAGAGVYGTTLFVLYLASTLYHSLFATKARTVFQRIDRSAIYVFIAGCYTPFALVPLRGPLGWGLLAAIWTLAIVGVVLECALRERFMVWSTALYLVMGWLALPFAIWIAGSLGVWGVAWMVVGGLAYTVGVGFFWWTALRFHHTIWHLFVAAGTICHFQAISGYVLAMH
jgi:hemolysin III